MEKELGKTALLSGKLAGTKTKKNVFEDKENLDDIELFLKEFINLKIKFDVSDEAIYINDDQDFLEYLAGIENSEYISIYTNDTLSRLYITTDAKKTYIIRMNKVSSAIIAKFIAEEKPIKFSLNSFSFIKWCVKQKIDMGSIYDIPTYIKILTNEVDPFKSIQDYLQEYTDYQLNEDDSESNEIIIGNFIYEFGKFLCDNTKKFGIDSICKLINENSYFEATSFDDIENCKITFDYKNLNDAISDTVESVEIEYKEKLYIVSPLGRIALKYGHNVKELIEELYLEDISITILNELYNNNIHVKLNEDNEYVASCKYKNINVVFSMITAVLNDIFYTMFKDNAEISINCDIKM